MEHSVLKVATFSKPLLSFLLLRRFCNVSDIKILHRAPKVKTMDPVHTGTPMDESVLPRRESRRQKLMEYLATKEKLKLLKIKSNVSKEDEKVKKDEIPVLKVATDKENETPAHKPSNKAPQPSHCVTRPLGVNNRENIKGSNLAQKQNQSANNKEAKANQLPVFSRTYTGVTSKSTINGVSHLKTQPNTREPSAGVASTSTHVNKITNNTMSSCANVASASMKKTVNKPTVNGMIYGPIVKTRTGLIPALTPRNKKSSNVVNKRSAAMTTETGNKAQKCNESLSNRLHPSLKQELSTSRCTVKSIKPVTSAGTSKTTNVSVGQPRSLSEVIKNKPSQGVTHPPSVPAARANLKINNKVTASNLGGKTKISKETESKKTGASTKATQAWGVTKRNEIPAKTQTAPQPQRAITLTNRPTDMKTPQVRAPPQSAQKKLTAAQEERIKKLQEWRESRGISYKRPAMLPKTQARRTAAVAQPFWSSMKEEDEVHSLICAVDRSLADCIKLLGEGCPAHQVKEVLSRLPIVAQKFVKYWICQARLMEQQGNLDVLPLFEKAVGVVLEPMDELRTVVAEILKKRDEKQVKGDDKERPAAQNVETPSEIFNRPMMTPKPVRVWIWGEKGESSVVKYKITATPGGPPGQQAKTTVVNGQEVRFFTPVRRSVRIERASRRYPVSLQDHDVCVASYNDLIAEEDKDKYSEQSECETNTPIYIYRENEALKDKVSVEFVCNDA